ncbi:hypothetical protein TWF281_007006 [Arthrobotrys megalospora]
MVSEPNFTIDLRIPTLHGAGFAKGSFAAALLNHIGGPVTIWDHESVKDRFIYILWYPIFGQGRLYEYRNITSITSYLSKKVQTFWLAPSTPYGISMEETARTLKRFLGMGMFHPDEKVAKSVFPDLDRSIWDDHPMIESGLFNYEMTAVGKSSKSKHASRSGGRAGTVKVYARDSRPIRGCVPRPCGPPVFGDSDLLPVPASSPSKIQDQNLASGNKRKGISPLRLFGENWDGEDDTNDADHLQKKQKQREGTSDYQHFVDKNLGPLSLPIHTLYEIFSEAQAILENACWEFFRNTMPRYASDPLYARPENFELLKWFEMLENERGRRTIKDNQVNKAVLLDGEPIGLLIQMLERVREIAVRRESCSVPDMRMHLVRAKRFTRYLMIESDAKKIGLLQTAVERIVTDAESMRLEYAKGLKPHIEKIELEMQKAKKNEEARGYELKEEEAHLFSLKERVVTVENRVKKLKEKIGGETEKRNKELENKLKFIQDKDKMFVAGLDWDLSAMLEELSTGGMPDAGQMPGLQIGGPIIGAAVDMDVGAGNAVGAMGGHPQSNWMYGELLGSGNQVPREGTSYTHFSRFPNSGMKGAEGTPGTGSNMQTFQQNSMIDPGTGGLQSAASLNQGMDTEMAHTRPLSDCLFTPASTHLNTHQTKGDPPIKQEESSTR